jgi:hypothetical protein
VIRSEDRLTRSRGGTYTGMAGGGRPPGHSKGDHPGWAGMIVTSVVIVRGDAEDPAHWVCSAGPCAGNTLVSQ